MSLDPQRESAYFGVNGVHVNSPSDAIPEGKAPVLENLRGIQEGHLEPRPGLALIKNFGVDTPVHSIKRLEDKIANDFARFVGVSTKLFVGNSANVFTEVSSAWSGDPLSFMAYRPDQSTQPWMYVADSAKMRKYLFNGTQHQIGLPAPKFPPGHGTPHMQTYGVGFHQKIIHEMDATAGLTAAGSATLAGTSTRANTTIYAIYYRNGSAPSWAHVSPISMDQISPGARLTFDLGGVDEEVSTVQSTHHGSSSTTISSVIFENGISGACWIHLTTPLKEIELDSMLQINLSEFTYVSGIAFAPDGTQSIRCTSLFAAAGQSLRALPSFMIGLLKDHAGGETINATNVNVTFTGAATGTVTATTALDLTQYGSIFEASDDDYIHISLMTDKPELITEGRVMFDIGDGSFTQNYYFAGFRAADITPALAGQQTLLGNFDSENRNRISEGRFGRNLPLRTPRHTEADFFDVDPSVPRDDDDDDDGATSSGRRRGARRPYPQAATGENQWTELWLRRGDFFKIGSRDDLNWSDVNKIRIQLTTTGTVTLEVDSWFIAGGFGPDASAPDAQPYFYRYRFRSSLTGAVSNYSPASREGITPRRQAVFVTYNSTDPAIPAEVDKIDFERWGGSILAWTYVGTLNRGGGGFIFNDTYSDDQIFINPGSLNENFQPWLTIDTPKSGTCGTIAGCYVRDSGTNFNTAWAPGTVITIGGVPLTIYRAISTSLIETIESAKAVSGADWYIAEPTLVSQPLPVLVGPFNGFVFGMGDDRNPGMLYWTNGNDPDSTREANRLEVTAPNDPLQNGCLYNDRVYIWSTQEMFEIIPNFSGQAATFQAVRIPGARGLLYRWAFAVGPRVWYRGKDGIYETDGGMPVSITDLDLRPLFPQEGVAGRASNNLFPPLDGVAYTGRHRMCYGDSTLYYDYPTFGTNASRTLTRIMRGDQSGWWPDGFTPNAVLHYSEEGEGVQTLLIASATKLFSVGGVSDDGAAIACRIDTVSHDQGNPRAMKLYQDLLVDMNPDGANITTDVRTTHRLTLAGSLVISSLARGAHIVDLNNGNGAESVNIALSLSWSSATKSPRLYRWDLSYLMRPEISKLRSLDYNDGGSAGAKYVRGFVLEADTNGGNRSVRLEYDGDQLAEVFTMNHNGRTKKAYTITTPFNAHLLRLLPTDVGDWQLYSIDWIFDPYPEFSEIITPWGDGGYAGLKFVQGVRITADTGGSPVDIEVHTDNETVPVTIIGADHLGKTTTAYSFETPFLAHLLRLEPLSNMRLFEAEWIFEPHPERALYWETQKTTHDVAGFFHLGVAVIAFECDPLDNVILEVLTDQDVDTYALGSSQSREIYRKISVQLRARKTRAVKYRIISENADGVRLFKRDCEVHVFPWGGSNYKIDNPFGDAHRSDGARI